MDVVTHKLIKVEVVEVVGVQGASGVMTLMKPDPREYFLSLLGGEIPEIPDEPEIPDIPDEPVIPDEPDYTLPILGSAKLNTMVLA